MVPPHFDEEFCAWFKHVTERSWAEAKPRSFDDYEEAGIGGLGWMRGTTWRPLDEAQIDAAEKGWGAPFPADYRLFLKHLHATHPPLSGALFVGPEGALTPVTRPGFYSWLTDAPAISKAQDDVIDGLVFDVENNRLWPPSWGERPEALAARAERVKDLVVGAPRLIPLYQHRLLLAEPCRAGNPVLSVHQSDIIVYGGELRDYLVAEFELEGAAHQHVETSGIPFWGELIG